MTEIINTKKKWYRKKYFYVILAAVFVLVSVVWSRANKNNTMQYETAKVQRGNVSQTVDATGNIESANELDLRFETAGKVSAIFKNTGSTIKKGEVVAQLDLGELNARVAQASANVAQAKANLDKQLAGDTPEYIAGLQASLDQALANLEQTKATANSAVNTADATLKTAENNMKLAEGGENSQIVEDEYNDMFALLQSVQNSLSSGLTQADNILGIDNTLANDDFEEVLSALDTSKLSIANNKYSVAKSAKIDVDMVINSLSKDSSHEKIDYAAQQADEAMIVMKDLLFSVSEVLNKTSAIGDLSQTELDTLKTNIETTRTSVLTKYTSLIQQMQAILNAKNSYLSYRIAYDKAVQDLQNTKNKASADIASAQALVDKAQASLDDAKNPPREVDVAGYRAALSEAQANLAQAVASRDKARIIAPLDGTIGKIDVKVGQYVSVSDIVGKLINPHYEVKVDIPETDIIKISIGNPAEIKLDAYGDDVKFTGSVTEIEKGETVIQDVVYYSVTVSMQENSEHNIYNGMTANIIFSTESKNDVLYIMQRAVRVREDGSKYVRVLENGMPKEVNITTGLRGDGGLVEVVTGLNEGQEVVINTIDNQK